MSNRLSTPRIQRRENYAVVTDEDQPPIRRQRTARASSATCLVIVPNRASGLDIQSADVPLPTGHPSVCTVEIALAHLEGLWNLTADHAGLVRRKEEQLDRRIVRR